MRLKNLIYFLLFMQLACAQNNKEAKKNTFNQSNVSTADSIKKFTIDNIKKVAPKNDQMSFMKYIEKNDSTCYASATYITKTNQFIVFAIDLKDYRIFYKFHFDEKRKFISKIKTDQNEAIEWKKASKNKLN